MNKGLQDITIMNKQELYNEDSEIGSLHQWENY